MATLEVKHAGGYKVVTTPMHEGTKREHASLPLPIKQRNTLNYCAICNGWFKRKVA